MLATLLKIQHSKHCVIAVMKSTSCLKNNRRAKITKLFKDAKDKRLVPKQSVNKQHLNLAKEGLAFKRKSMESSEEVEHEFLNNTIKRA